MAAENLEVVRAMYERRERGDMDVGEFVHPEIVFARIGSETQTARGKRSGAVIGQEVGTMLTLRDGRIARWEYYWERAEALEAAGISE
jgi:ketosteroid isomerase-like protein